MVKLDEKEKKTLDEAFLRYILEILKLNTEKSPLFKQSLIEFAKSGLPIPTTFLYAKQANKWSSLARIILLQNNQKSEKLSSLLSTSQDKTPSFMGKKDENLKLKEDNEKLKVLIAALEKKLNLNLHELQSFQEDDSNDFKALAKELGNVSIKDLEAISKEKDMILDHLTRLNQEFSDYNQKLLAVKGENTQESNLLLFKFANLKDPKADLKTKIKELKEENHYLKQKLTDIYGASIDLPLQVSNGELNKSSKNQESQIIKKNRNTYEMSPNKIFDPIRSHKVENLAYSDIEVLFQVRNNKERSYSAQKERESYKKTLNEPFSGSDMRESVKLEQKDRSFYMRKTNKNEDFLVEDKKIKNRANGFRIGVLEQMKEFKDFEEFAKERINQLKKACLMNRGVLYEDNEVQLGFVSGVFYHKEEIFLKITAYFGNMSDKDLEKFEVKFIGNSSNLYFLCKSNFFRNYI